MPKSLVRPQHLWWLLPLLIAWMFLMGASPRSEMPLRTVTLFDVTWRGYDASYANRVFEELGPSGRNTYMRWHFPLDMVFPLLYGATLYCLLAWATTSLGTGPALRKVIVALPIIAAATDWLENILVFSMIAPQPPRASLAPIASIFTQIKCFTLVLSIVLVVILGLAAVVKRRGLNA